jgi:FMN-dependent NADH-azoreductase
MARLLYITASPRGEKSFSLRTGSAFIDAYRKSHPADDVVTMDLNSTPLPELCSDAIGGRYAAAQNIEQTPEQAKAWSEIKAVAENFKSFDKYVISTPMWNFGIPYTLKHFIDVIWHPTLTFGYVDGKRVGFIKGKPIVVIYARGGEYKGAKKKIDFQKPYLEWVLSYIGFEDIKSIVVGSTLMGEDIANENLKKAIGKARRMAKDF